MKDNDKMDFIIPKENGIELKIRLHPNAKKDAFTGIWNDTHLKIDINAPAIDGKANTALINFLAKFLHIRKSAIKILSGETSREKRLFIQDLTDKDLLDKINI
mgnify:FL=1